MCSQPDRTNAVYVSHALALDLEFDQNGFQCGALVYGETQIRFGPEQMADIAQVLRGVPLVIGHNIRRFDLPQLSQLLREPVELAEHHLLDTLELAALVWPGRPSQALEKLYRDTQPANDPVEDCEEALRVLEDAAAAASALPPLVRHWARRLLPEGALRNLIPEAAEDWQPVTGQLGEAAAAALRTHLQDLPEAQPGNLGAVIFLHWFLLRGITDCP